MRATRFTSAGLTVLTAVCAVSAALAQEVHFSPEERLDAVDVLPRSRQRARGPGPQALLSIAAAVGSRSGAQI